VGQEVRFLGVFRRVKFAYGWSRHREDEDL